MQSSKWNAMSLLMDDKTKQAEVLRTAIEEAEAIVIGIGAGMSASDGFTYVGERFTKNFPDFIEKYRLTCSFTMMRVVVKMSNATMLNLLCLSYSNVLLNFTNFPI